MPQLSLDFAAEWFATAMTGTPEGPVGDDPGPDEIERLCAVIQSERTPKQQYDAMAYQTTVRRSCLRETDW